MNIFHENDLKDCFDKNQKFLLKQKNEYEAILDEKDKQISSLKRDLDALKEDNQKLNLELFGTQQQYLNKLVIKLVC